MPISLIPRCSHFHLSSVHFSGLDRLARNLFAGDVGSKRDRPASKRDRLGSKRDRLASKRDREVQNAIV